MAGIVAVASQRVSRQQQNRLDQGTREAARPVIDGEGGPVSAVAGRCPFHPVQVWPRLAPTAD